MLKDTLVFKFMNLNTKKIFQKAENGRYAIPQLNVSSADQMKAVVKAAEKLRSPIMFGTSEGESGFLGMEQAVVLANFYEKKTGLPVILNADHTKSLEKVKQYLDAGYNSIHFDGSLLPYEENLELTKKAVKMCREVSEDISVEGELGQIGGTGSSKVFEEKIEIKDEYLTDPKQALEFVETTGVDRLGVSIGNMHGISKVAMPKLDMQRLSELQETLKGKCVLVLHGASGIPDEDVKKSVELGIRKINVNTELRVVFSSAIKEKLEEGEITPYKFIAPAQEKMQKVVEEKMLICGSNGKA